MPYKMQILRNEKVYKYESSTTSKISYPVRYTFWNMIFGTVSRKTVLKKSWLNELNHYRWLHIIECNYINCKVRLGGWTFSIFIFSIVCNPLITSLRRYKFLIAGDKIFTHGGACKYTYTQGFIDWAYKTPRRLVNTSYMIF